MHISVLMSVLNGERYLEEALESILNQSHTDFTFLIIDNGSTDRTTDILSLYACRDERVTILTNTETVPLTAAREQGMKALSTEWVALMDADDISEPQRLMRQVEYLEEHGSTIGALGAWARYISADGRVLGNAQAGPTTVAEFEQLYAINEATALVDPTTVIHRPTFLAVGGYRPEYTPAGDIDLWYRIAESGRQILAIPEYLLQYRVHAGSDSVKKTMLQRKKTHFLNHNMRLRRKGRDELSWRAYQDEVWSRLRYRIPRLRRDWGMTYYKKAGTKYGERRLVSFGLNLLAATAIHPRFVLIRLLKQKATQVVQSLNK